MKHKLVISLLAAGFFSGCGGGNNTSPPPPISVLVSPATANIHVTNTQQFTATVQNSSNTSVTWSVSGSGCTGADCGTISATGLYTAPANVPSKAAINVTATSVADTTKSNNAVATILAAVIVAVTPSGMNVEIAKTQQFTANVQNAINSAVTWNVSGTGCTGSACGTINSSGLYTAPSLVPNPASISITATSVEDPKKSGATSAAIISYISVLMWPAKAQVTAPPNVNYGVPSRQFTWLVTGFTNTALNWTVTGAGCSGNTCGTISNTGLYVPPNAIPNPEYVTVTATSQADPGKFASATVELVPSDNAKLNGTYGFFTQGYALGAPGQAGGIMVADGHGNITYGVADRTWPNSVGGNLVNVPFTGTYTINSDNRGTITINSTSFGTVTYAIVLNAEGDEACMQPFYDVTTRLVGELVKQDLSTFNNAGIKGDYVFQMTGNDSTYARQAQVGRFHADGNGNITAGNLDLNDGVNVTNNLAFTGTYSVSSNGRTTLALTVSGHGTLNYVGYLLSANQFNLMSIDTIATNAPMMGGTALLQQGGPFSNGSLNAATVFQISGLPAANHPKVSIGLLAGDGNGHITGIADIGDDTTPILNTSYTASYAIDAHGRGTVTSTSATLPNMILYLVSPNQALLMEASVAPGAALASGAFEPQMQLPYSNALLMGHFMGYSNTVLYPNYVTSTGVIDYDGAGNYTAAADMNSTNAGLWHWSGTSSDTVAANGRVTIPTGAYAYLVSPVKYVLIHWPQPDNQAHVNIAEQ